MLRFIYLCGLICEDIQKYIFNKIIRSLSNPWIVKICVIFCVCCLSVVLFFNCDFSFIESDTTMFALSVGLVSIVTYISRFLETRISDRYLSDDYYLGRNLKRKLYYDNFWLIIFNHFPAKLLFWIIALIPGIVLFQKVPAKKAGLLFWDLKRLIGTHELWLKSIWCSVFAVVSLLCVGVLIESIYLTRKTFSGRSKYSRRLVSDAKESIRNQVKDEYSKFFNKTFSISRMNRYVIRYRKLPQDEISRTIREVLESEGGAEEISIYSIIHDVHDLVGNKPDELNEYFDIVFEAENSALKKRVEDCFRAINKKRPFCGLYKTLMLQFLNLYYSEKWQAIETSQKVYFSEVNLINMAVYDLSILCEIDSVFLIDDEYLRVFWGMPLPLSKRHGLSTRSISRPRLYRCDIEFDYYHTVVTFILKVFHDLICKPEFVLALDKDSLLIIDFFSKLKAFENNGKKRVLDSNGKLLKYNASSNIFNEWFRMILNEELYDNNTISELRKKIVNVRWLKDWIVDESISILSDDIGISQNAIEYLLSFLSFPQLNALLIFRLDLYEKTCNRKMPLTEYTIWKNAFNVFLDENDVLCAEDIKYINYFFEELSDNPFKDSSFVVWLLNSLNYDLSDEILNQFNGYNNSNFSFASYVLFRLMYQKMDFGFVFKMRNKKEIKKQFKEIEDVMKYEKLDFKKI